MKRHSSDQSVTAKTTVGVVSFEMGAGSDVIVTSGAVDLHCLVSDWRPLDEAAGAFAQAAARTGLKTVLVP